MFMNSDIPWRYAHNLLLKDICKEHNGDGDLWQAAAVEGSGRSSWQWTAVEGSGRQRQEVKRQWQAVVGKKFVLVVRHT